VASRRFGSPVPRRRGLGDKPPRIGGGKSLVPGARNVNVSSTGEQTQNDFP
jgi:hypothetical protein